MGFRYSIYATTIRFTYYNICATCSRIRIWCLHSLDYCLDCFISIFPPMLLWSVNHSQGISCVWSHVTLLLSFSNHQGQKVATCLFITCPRSSEMQSSCKCSCLLATSSLPKSLWTERPIRANVLVSQKLTMKRREKMLFFSFQ